jgi:RimJ/RimL family protein N-acetyltransferase
MPAFDLHDAGQISDVLLAQGGEVVIVRPVEVADAAPLQAYFCTLSVRSRYNRLMGAASELPAAQLEQFVHAGDGRFTVLATVMQGGLERIVGEARYAFDEDSERVEFGLSIGDQWQRRGLGTALLSNVECRAAALGADIMFGDTLRSNDAMLALARKAGFSFTRTPGDWKQVRFEKRIGLPVISGRVQRQLRAPPESRAV